MLTEMPTHSAIWGCRSPVRRRAAPSTRPGSPTLEYSASSSCEVVGLSIRELKCISCMFHPFS